MTSRIYNKQETEQLIRRAVEMETSRTMSEEANVQEGLTLDEISAIAAESGIDPEFIRKADKEFAPDHLSKSQETTKPRKDVKKRDHELYFEKWLSVKADPQITDLVISDLNHRFAHDDEEPLENSKRIWGGVYSDDEDWGPKIIKIGSSTEWRSYDYYGMYETRVLLQPRGDKMRIRVSKRNTWGGSWSDSSMMFMYVLPVFLTICGAATYALWDMAWTGIFAGSALWAITYPFMKQLLGRSVNKHYREVQQLGEELCEMIDLLNQKEGGSSEG